MRSAHTQTVSYPSSHTATHLILIFSTGLLPVEKEMGPPAQRANIFRFSLECASYQQTGADPCPTTDYLASLPLDNLPLDNLPLDKVGRCSSLSDSRLPCKYVSCTCMTNNHLSSQTSPHRQVDAGLCPTTDCPAGVIPAKTRNLPVSNQTTHLIIRKMQDCVQRKIDLASSFPNLSLCFVPYKKSGQHLSDSTHATGHTSYERCRFIEET